MATQIHPTAIVESGAELGENVEVGAFCWVGSRVVLGDGSRLHHHTSVEGRTILGKDNEIFPYAFLGGRTQDKKWTGEISETRIGDRNTFREFTTLHPATFENKQTVIGSDCLFCCYAHIGHESHVGNGVVFSNNATLGGHVSVGDRAVIGGLTPVHQFCRIGRVAMVGGGCKVVQDVLPFMLAEGSPVEHRTVNKIGMQRAGYTEEEIQIAVRIYKVLFREGLNRSQAITAIRDRGLADNRIGREVLDFMDSSQRGLA